MRDKESNIASHASIMTHQTSCVLNRCVSNALHARNDYCVRNASCAFGGKSIIDDGFNAAAFLESFFFTKSVLGGENYDFMLHFMGFHLHQPEARVVALDVVKRYTQVDDEKESHLNC